MKPRKAMMSTPFFILSLLFSVSLAAKRGDSFFTTLWNQEYAPLLKEAEELKYDYLSSGFLFPKLAGLWASCPVPADVTDQLEQVDYKLSLYRSLSSHADVHPLEAFRVEDSAAVCLENMAIDGERMFSLANLYAMLTARKETERTISDPAVKQSLRHDDAFRFVVDDLAPRAFGNITLADLHDLHRHLTASPTKSRLLLRDYPIRDVGAQSGFLFYPEPEEVRVLIFEFFDEWFRERLAEHPHPVVLATEALHKLFLMQPYVDMNNQTARLVFSALLLQAGFPPTAFSADDAEAFSTALVAAGRALQSPPVQALVSQFAVERPRQPVPLAEPALSASAKLKPLTLLAHLAGGPLGGGAAGHGAAQDEGEFDADVDATAGDCGPLYRLAVLTVENSLDRAIERLQQTRSIARGGMLLNRRHAPRGTLRLHDFGGREVFYSTKAGADFLAELREQETAKHAPSMLPGKPGRR